MNFECRGKKYSLTPLKMVELQEIWHVHRKGLEVYERFKTTAPNSPDYESIQLKHRQMQDDEFHLVRKVIREAVGLQDPEIDNLSYGEVMELFTEILRISMEGPK